MYKIPEIDLLQIKTKIEDISCHIDFQAVKDNGGTCLDTMIEETQRLLDILKTMGKYIKKINN